MILESFDNLPVKKDRMYGGSTGSKICVEYNNRVWMLKTSQSLKHRLLKNVEVSYANDVISEYIGSHIYEIFDIPVHDTILGTYQGKECVLCSDDAYPEKLYEFREFRNTLMDDSIIQHSSGMSCSLDDIFQVIDLIPDWSKEEVYSRFWAMFVIDALIGNTDRNNGNWGFLFDGEKFNLYEVYDCGGCLNNKRSDSQMSTDINSCRVESFAINYTVNYLVNGKRINPLKFIENNHNKYIDATLSKFNEGRYLKLRQLISSLSDVIPPIRMNWYLEVLTTRWRYLENLKPKKSIYSKLETLIK